jgi:hypothetical protein
MSEGRAFSLLVQNASDRSPVRHVAKIRSCEGEGLALGIEVFTSMRKGKGDHLFHTVMVYWQVMA